MAIKVEFALVRLENHDIHETLLFLLTLPTNIATLRNQWSIFRGVFPVKEASSGAAVSQGQEGCRAQAAIPVGVAVVLGSEDRQQPAEEQHHQANASNAHNCKRCTGTGWEGAAAPANTSGTQVPKAFCNVYRFGQMKALPSSLRNTKLTPILHQFYRKALRKSPFFSLLLAKHCKASLSLSICQKDLSCSLLSNSKTCQKSKWFCQSEQNPPVQKHFC